ncbi:MAG: hypothetical protein EKK62_01640 [Acidimicrobiia bacterium]|nr:MAG: hypothetical protein EKK62_01640 [Acidimicrobiia bacterium]
MTDRLHTALATAIAELEWFKTPHTIDQVVGLYSEALAGRTMRYRYGVTNGEMVESLKASGTGGSRGCKGDHSDPTPDAALRGQPDATNDTDRTLTAIDTCLTNLTTNAHHLAHHCNPTTTWTPTPTTRQGHIAYTLLHLRTAHPNLTAPHTDPTYTDELIRTHIADDAAWLHDKATDIWHTSHGDTQPVATQRAIVECRICGTWRRGTIAVAAGRCQECSNFFRNHQCEATEAIVRRWAYSPTALPGQILEAKAASRKRKRAAS